MGWVIGKWIDENLEGLRFFREERKQNQLAALWLPQNEIEPSVTVNIQG